MVNTKGLAFVFFLLSMTATFGYQALTETTKPTLTPHVTISEVNQMQPGMTLDKFIEQTIAASQVSSNVANDDKFKLLKTQTILESNELNTPSGSLADYASKVNKLHKMQKLATFISDNYNVPLPNAEKIVYSTFIESQKKNLDPTLVLSLIKNESTFNQFSKSRMGAVGLTQVMPNVHKVRISELWKDKLDIWSIHGNIKVGTDILKEYVDLAGGNVKKALRMYNGSSGDGYGDKILQSMRTFKTASL